MLLGCVFLIGFLLLFEGRGRLLAGMVGRLLAGMVMGKLTFAQNDEKWPTVGASKWGNEEKLGVRRLLGCSHGRIKKMFWE